MAFYHITFSRAMDGIVPVTAAEPTAAQTLTANGTTTIAATATPNEICTIATDTACYVAFGATPTAGADNGHFMPAGSVRAWGHLKSGWKVAITAA